MNQIANPVSTKYAATPQVDESPFATVDPVWHNIAAFQFTPLVERLQAKEGHTFEQAQQVFYDMKQFLYLCGCRQSNGSQPMVPPESIDIAWHHFILFTSA